jgi:hypothetical protein
MKHTSKFIAMFIVVLCLTSCRVIDGISNEYPDFALDLIHNPEKAYDIKNNYSKYYKKEYFHYSMLDSNYIKKYIVDECYENFKDDSNKLYIMECSEPESVIESWNNYDTPIKYHFNANNLLLFSISNDKKNRSIDFLFVKEAERYYIFKIFISRIRL